MSVRRRYTPIDDRTAHETERASLLVHPLSHISCDSYVKMRCAARKKRWATTALETGCLESAHRTNALRRQFLVGSQVSTCDIFQHVLTQNCGVKHDLASDPLRVFANLFLRCNKRTFGKVKFVNRTQKTARGKTTFPLRSTFPACGPKSHCA
jgi:hypothetical protein